MGKNFPGMTELNAGGRLRTGAKVDQTLPAIPGQLSLAGPEFLQASSLWVPLFDGTFSAITSIECGQRSSLKSSIPLMFLFPMNVTQHVRPTGRLRLRL